MGNKSRLIYLDEALAATYKEVWFSESEAAAIRSFLLKLPRVDAVEISRLGRLGKLMMPYEGCPRGKIGPSGSTGDSSDQTRRITTLDVITDIDGNRWIPVLDTDLWKYRK